MDTARWAQPACEAAPSGSSLLSHEGMGASQLMIARVGALVFHDGHGRSRCGAVAAAPNGAGRAWLCGAPDAELGDRARALDRGQAPLAGGVSGARGARQRDHLGEPLPERRARRGRAGPLRARLPAHRALRRLLLQPVRDRDRGRLHGDLLWRRAGVERSRARIGHALDDHRRDRRRGGRRWCG